ncbi:RNA-binding S4 domain-containing protein [Sediminitomix flava]|uniref:Ribosome-associated heat shock protein Hsp15 n=1 Tax=Sediminitomix flava TaxID=379075 RepID=A0A315ZC22_SEDFL|nr:S4 domain-containing protein [Sediminitomix flava]PWJ42643.1 ribosome-associated heat shock protein Hsp15 [Sediminitomix flava]
MRIDKCLWALRLFKSRTIATEACKNGQVKLNGAFVKPSAKVSEGDHVEIFKKPIWREYLLKELVEKRVAASIAVECYEEMTSEEELKKLQDFIDEKQFYLGR